MIPDPLHPAVVHLPIALAILIPGLAILGVYLIRRRLVPAHTWGLLVLLQALLVGSGWMALETGEDQEDRVEQIVAERHIETHEEAAERFMVFAGLGLLAMGAGLLPSGTGAAARVAGSAAALVVLAAGVPVGHSGGELVYKHGAAGAYVDAAAGVPLAHTEWDHDDDD
jgi:uncharacterized membrane protein